MCEGDDSPPRWHIGASYGIFASKLKLTSIDGNVDVLRRAALVSLDSLGTGKVTLQFALGAALPGALGLPARGTIPAERIAITPGGMASFAVSWRMLNGSGSSPFLLFGASFAASVAGTERKLALASPERAALGAIDARFGITVGKTFFDRLSPYGVVRAFGGPVLWSYAGQTAGGTDLYHFQIGAGLVVALPRRLDVFVEGVPLGERAMTIGVGKSL
jgi:hypothetical protein